MDNLVEFIKPELMIMIPVLYLIGAAFKKSEMNNKYIPLLLGVISIFAATIYLFAVNTITGIEAIFNAIFTAFTQGILCAGASVYVNQLIKQAKKDEEEDNG